MILNKQGIIEAIENKEIIIERHGKPFNQAQISANSIDLTLSPYIIPIDTSLVEINALTGEFFNKHTGNKVELKQIEIPLCGYKLKKGFVYLACTNERIWSNKYVPICKDKSSMGRMFCPTHFNAGLGDLGFDGYYTLEISPNIDIKVYRNMAICQMMFIQSNSVSEAYKESGRYNNDMPFPMLSKGTKIL